MRDDPAKLASAVADSVKQLEGGGQASSSSAPPVADLLAQSQT